MQASKFSIPILSFLMLLTSPALGFRCLICYNDEGCAEAADVPSIDCQEEYGAAEWSQCLKVVSTCKLSFLSILAY